MKTKQDIINNYAHDFRNMVWSFDSLKRILTNMVNEIEDLDQDKPSNDIRKLLQDRYEFEEVEELYAEHQSLQTIIDAAINKLIRNQDKLIEIITSLQK